MTRVSGDWLTGAAAQAALGLLTEAGYQGHVVGGCVRDALLGRGVSDVDIATDAHPDRVMELAKAAGIRALPTGIDHGTITLMIDGRGYEVTTYRRDVATDGRRATVAFATDMATDAARRDFTMNALYADAAGRLSDPLGGLADLTARRVRFIGDARTRIAEDALRILRFFRFHAQLGDAEAGIDPEGLAACAAGVDRLAHLSAERIGGEMRKLLGARDPAPALASMAASGVLAAICPGADASLIAPLVAVEADHPPHWQRRLVALTGADMSAPWRLSRSETAALKARRAALAAMEPPAVAAYRHGPDVAIDASLIAAASGAPLPEDLAAAAARGAAQICPVSARDLMPPMTPGPELGTALKAAETAWIESDFTLDRRSLLAQIKSMTQK